MMNQLWLVAKNAYLKRLKSFSFWALIIGPLLVPIIAIGISYLSGNGATPKLAVVNEPALVQALKQEKSIDATISEVASKSEAQKQLNNHDIDGFLIFNISLNLVHRHARSLIIQLLIQHVIKRSTFCFQWFLRFINQ